MSGSRGEAGAVPCCPPRSSAVAHLAAKPPLPAPPGPRPLSRSSGSSPLPVGAALAPVPRFTGCLLVLVYGASVLSKADLRWARAVNPSKRHHRGQLPGVGGGQPASRRAAPAEYTASRSIPLRAEERGPRAGPAGSGNRGRAGAAGSSGAPPPAVLEIGCAKPRSRWSRDQKPPPRARLGESGPACLGASDAFPNLVLGT